MRGISHLSFGLPEKITPTKFKKSSRLQNMSATTFPVERIRFQETDHGCLFEFPLLPGERVYGFGLQLKGFNHLNKKYCLRSNADPLSDSGDSHAPVPFYVTSEGYGVLIDTARYISVYIGCWRKARDYTEEGTSAVSISTDEIYHRRDITSTGILVDIPVAKGADVYIFQGDTLTEAVQLYNLFSGGGCMPALWGLGMFYRCFARSSQKQVCETAEYFRKHHLPCDVIGLEPGWQSHSYSCSYRWNPDLFPNPDGLLLRLKGEGFKTNLWEHAFVNAKSPIYESLYDLSGDFEVWNGLVPDFSNEKASDLFADYHRQEFIEHGVTGFKLDECDGSDFTGDWTFPNCSKFPNGMDGEQMHSLFGILYQRTILTALGNTRTLSNVRNSHACAAPYPFVLYSDLYDHRDFIRGLVNAGFCGLLWTPEVRDAKSKEDFIRRLQTAVFSPQTMINAWYLDEKTPWERFDAENEVRRLIECRMSLIPYLYSAFYQYYKKGIPPVRALVCDYTDDAETYNIDHEYLYGDAMLVAPMVEGEKGRRVYLPAGIWYDFWTEKVYESGWHEIITDRIPVFVHYNSIVPVAKPLQFLDPSSVFQLELRCYGEKGKCSLIVDDGITNKTEYKELTVDFSGRLPGNERYRIYRVRHIGPTHMR